MPYLCENYTSDTQDHYMLIQRVYWRITSTASASTF